MELAIEYTSPPVYLEKLVRFFVSSPLREVREYARRGEELALAAQVAAKSDLPV
jgi:hypothetical protein